jgi:aldose 1-epimerase
MEIATKRIYRELFGRKDGEDIHLFTLTNKSGNCVSITNFGCIITAWNVTDKQGVQRNIVLGFKDLETYLQPHPYIGVIAGRYANRIAYGRFQIDDEMYQVTQNEAPHQLHGGYKGFDKVVWDATIEEDMLVLKYHSIDGEEGYPGNLEVQVSYSFDDDNALSISYSATTDKETPINLTSHSYFNLTGNASNNILDHLLTINASHYTPVTSEGIPTGIVESVRDTIFDFSKERAVKHQSSFADYDHNYVLDGNDGSSQKAATLIEGASGIKLEVFTTEPGMQLYTGIHLDGSFQNSNGESIEKYSGICLETQHFPDSPNHPNFPETILQPGKVYRSTTVYKVGTHH